MNFFAERAHRRMVHGSSVPASWFQSVNPVVLIIVSPLFASLWTALGRRGREPSTPVKMAAAMFLIGAGLRVDGRAARAPATAARW